jgi:hypothetical protein
MVKSADLLSATGVKEPWTDQSTAEEFRTHALQQDASLAGQTFSAPCVCADCWSPMLTVALLKSFLPAASQFQSRIR